MPFVCAERLGFAFTDRVTVFDDVSFRLSPGWYGLVGANGVGKTTLARLIHGELRPSVGRLWLEPDSAEVVVCRQELDQPEPDLLQFAQRSDRESCRLRGLLELGLADLDRWESLSPGERKRWQLAAALGRNPDVLIVDEPTNHLDAAGREFLIRALLAFQGVGIAISHDRELLAALTTATLRIHASRIEVYAASYAEARQHWEAALLRNVELREQAVARQRKIEQRITAANRDLQSAKKNRSARTRMKNIHDHDGSSFVANGRAAMGEANISRRLKVMATERERASEAVPEFQIDKTLGRSVFLGYESAPMPHLVGILGEDLHAGSRTILSDVRVILERNARVHLRGPNGAGKTTLIQALLARAERLKDHVLYLPQELSSEQVHAIQTASCGLPRDERGRIMALLCALGVDPERVFASEALSPGEARKLKLAFGLALHAWALILDEPTNHLDLPSIERLEQALAAYPGAILLVSHDAQFASSCTNRVWEIRDGKVTT